MKESSEGVATPEVTAGIRELVVRDSEARCGRFGALQYGLPIGWSSAQAFGQVSNRCDRRTQPVRVDCAIGGGFLFVETVEMRLAAMALV